jgi:hypothetical protein
VVVTSTVTAASSEQAKEDSTFVMTTGNNTTASQNQGCVSFESVNRPGEFLRHQNFVLHLQPNDGSALFAQDSTFCPATGNNGQGTSFQSDNFPGGSCTCSRAGCTSPVTASTPAIRGTPRSAGRMTQAGSCSRGWRRDRGPAADPARLTQNTALSP